MIVHSNILHNFSFSQDGNVHTKKSGLLLFCKCHDVIMVYDFLFSYTHSPVALSLWRRRLTTQADFATRKPCITNASNEYSISTVSSTCSIIANKSAATAYASFSLAVPS